MKIYNLSSLSFALLLFFTSCRTEDKLTGTWKRYGDLFAGLTIRVEQEGESFKGTIIEITDSCKIGGLAVGDVKWKNIKNMVANKYEFEDLGKTQIGVNMFEPNYALSSLEMVTDNEIYTRRFSKGTELVGTEQRWKRVVDK